MAKYLDLIGLKKALTLLKGNIETKVGTKMDKFTVGTGLELKNGAMNVTLDTSIAKIVTTLPAAPAAGDTNKIHFVPSGKTGTNDVYSEYIWLSNKWEKLGEFTPGVDLTPYVKKDGTGATGTWNISINGLAGTATKLATARTITVGSTGKSFDGSGNISFTLSEIGAAAASHTHTFASLTSKPTTIAGYGITDAKISNGVITLGGNTITPITAHQSLGHLLKIDGSNGTSSGVSSLLNKLGTGTSTPLDDNYYIAQAIEDSDTIRYIRRPVSSLWNYMKGKADAMYQPKGNYLTGITKAQVEAVLTGNITSHRHTDYLSKKYGGYMEGDLYFKYNPEADPQTPSIIFGGDTDKGAIRFNVTGSDLGYLEISTHDNGNEPVYVSQYKNNSVVTADLKNRAVILDEKGDTQFPHTVTAEGFVKKDGTASQFLMADGSVKALSDITGAYVTALGTSGNYLTWTKDGATNNITIPYATKAGKLNEYIYTGDLNDVTTEYHGKLLYSKGSNTVTNKPSGVDAYGMLVMRTADGYTGQLLMSSNSATSMYWRTVSSASLGSWKALLDSSNYTTYAPTKTGTGASGTWGISITGKAATATKLATGRTITVGSTGKSFDGSGNISFTLAEIGINPDNYLKSGDITFDPVISPSGNLPTGVEAVLQHGGLLFIDGTPNLIDELCIKEDSGLSLSRDVYKFLSLKEITQASGGALKKIEIDKYGRVTKSSAVTASDITALGIASSSSLSSHTGNTTVHITAAERTKWNKVVTDFSAITGTDTDTIINKWEEVVKFLNNYTEADTLAGLLGNKVDKVSGKGLSTNDFTTALLNKLNGIEAGANKYTLPVATASARGGAKIGYSANGKNYPVQLDSNEKMFVNVPWTDTNTVYTHPTTAGNKHIPAGGSSGKILGWSSDGTAVWSDRDTLRLYNTDGTGSTDITDVTTTQGYSGVASLSVGSGRKIRIIGQGGVNVLPYSDDKGGYFAISVPTALAGLQDGLMSKEDKAKLDGIATGANKYTHPTTSGNKHIPSGGSAGQILRWSADGTAVWGADNNTTYSNMTAATASAAGKAGLVPAPAAGKQASYLRGDGTWAVPTNTTYSVATQSANGLLSSSDKKKLDNINGLRLYNTDGTGTKDITDVTTPQGYSGAASLYVGSGKKIRIEGNGVAVSPYTDADGGYIRISVSTAMANFADGLMSKEDKSKLDGIATGANKYVHPTTSGNKHIPSGGSTGKILRWSADGTATWGDVDTLKVYSDNTDLTNQTGSAGYPGVASIGLGSGKKIRIKGMGSSVSTYVDESGGYILINTPLAMANFADGLMSKEDKSKLDSLSTTLKEVNAADYAGEYPLYFKVDSKSLGYSPRIYLDPDANALYLGDTIFTDNVIESQNSQGDFSINAPNGRLSISGLAVSVSATDTLTCNKSWNVYSDRRSKRDIINISESSLERLDDITYKQFKYIGGSDDEYYGVIAQDILKLGIPNIVSGSEEKGYSVNYNNLFVLEIMNLKNQIKQLKETLANMMDQINVK